MSSDGDDRFPFYADSDPRHVPRYYKAEAARYLRISPATLRTWVLGRTYPRGPRVAFSEPLIQLPDSEDGRLSFTNLVEAHVLNGLRSSHRVPMHAVRTALAYAESTYGIERLLVHPDLRAVPGEVLLERLDELVNLGKAGQLALRKVLSYYLQRLERDVAGLPSRLYPFVPGMGTSMNLLIDPLVSFGRPIVKRRGISTAVIAERVDAGETLSFVAADYDLEEDEVEEAIIYERAA